MRELSECGSASGAQMGRSNILGDATQPVAFEVERLDWVDGDYDRGGAYWGRNAGEYIYRFEGESDAGIESMFVRARTLQEAVALLMETYPLATLADSAGLSAFVSSYREAALWSSSNSRYEDDPDNEPEMLDDASYELSDELEQKFAADCRDFLARASDLLERAREEKGYSIEQAGHDFWLTRSRSGVGFWDRDLGSIGDELTEIAHEFGEDDLYVGDDDLVYSERSYIYRAEAAPAAP